MFLSELTACGRMMNADEREEFFSNEFHRKRFVNGLKRKLSARITILQYSNLWNFDAFQHVVGRSCVWINPLNS